MENIAIKITKAKIYSYTVRMTDGLPTVDATIELLTESGKQITSYSISSSHWQDHMKFNIPVEMVEPLIAISRQLEMIVAQHCQSSCKQIEFVEVPNEI